jgi:hypothetical protein
MKATNIRRSGTMSTELTTINFHGDELAAIQQDGITYAPIKPICDILGLDWEAQRQRIERDEVLSTCACMIQVQIPHDDQRRDMVCLPDEMIHGWLFGVEVKRVRPELRERLILYKRECYRVLHQAFTAPTQPALTKDDIRSIVQEELSSRLGALDYRMVPAAKVSQTERVYNFLVHHSSADHPLSPVVLAREIGMRCGTVRTIVCRLFRAGRIKQASFGAYYCEASSLVVSS